MNHSIYICILLSLLLTPSVKGGLLKVVSPEENSHYNAGDTLTIAYEKYEVDSIKIEIFTPVNGGTWELMINNLPTSFGNKISIPNIQSPEWPNYQIRIIDISGNSDTAYSGIFSINNINKPVINFNIHESEAKVNAKVQASWSLSPSIETIIIEALSSGDTTWQKINTSISPSDNTTTFLLPKHLQEGWTYFRLTSTFPALAYSNIDSIYVLDEYFAGIQNLYPAKGKQNVDIFLKQEKFIGMMVIRFAEPVILNNTKSIDLYHDEDGLITSFSADNLNLFKDTAGKTTLLGITLEWPLKHSSGYYLLADPNIVQDNAGNTFNGLQSPTVWSFRTEILHEFTGKIFYSGPENDPIALQLFHQADINNLSDDAPVNLSYNPVPVFPYFYEIGAPTDGYYGIRAYIDLNRDGKFSQDEPAAFIDSLSIQGKDSLNINLTIKNKAAGENIFKLDTKRSYWGQKKTFSYDPFRNYNFSNDAKHTHSLISPNGMLKEHLYWQFSFGLLETDSAELKGSSWDLGTTFHLEYTYPDSLLINYISACGDVSACKISSKRLSIDLTVIDPVTSNKSDLNATLGLVVSCSSSHSNDMNAHKSIFYGNFLTESMEPSSYTGEDAIGVLIDGKDGAEGTFNALLSDSFLINTYSSFNATNLPPNSTKLRSFIPGLSSSFYTTNNTYSKISSGFDIDDDGKDNLMYRVSINNSIWSKRNVMFGLDVPTATNMHKITKDIIWYTHSNNTLQCQSIISNLEIYGLNSQHVRKFSSSGKTFKLDNSLPLGIYILRYQINKRYTTQKLVVY